MEKIHQILLCWIKIAFVLNILIAMMMMLLMAQLIQMHVFICFLFLVCVVNDNIMFWSKWMKQKMRISIVCHQIHVQEWSILESKWDLLFFTHEALRKFRWINQNKECSSCFRNFCLFLGFKKMRLTIDTLIAEPLKIGLAGNNVTFYILTFEL